MKDVNARLAAIGSRINACGDASERYVDEVLPELSLPRSAEMPKMVRVIRSRLKPSQMTAYTNLLKAEALPTMKKAGGKFFTSQGPMTQAMGEAAYQQYLAKVRALLDESEVNLYRHMPDLSYTASK